MIYPLYEQLLAEVEAGNIRMQKHPKLPLRIYNYTPQAVYSRYWPRVVREARGLILTDSGDMVARPFEKFFNLEEAVAMGEPIPAAGSGCRRVIFEKLDGFLVIVCSFEGTRVVATRGSFTSAQALTAAMWLNSKAGNWIPPAHQTHLFEGLFKEHRIVVDYPTDCLIHLGGIITTSGVFVEPQIFHLPFCQAVQTIGMREDVEAAGILAQRGWAYKQNDDNREGYVVFWRNMPQHPDFDWEHTGYRVKIKLPEYVRKHRARFSMKPWVVWEHLLDEASGRPAGSFDALLEPLPENMREDAVAYKTMLLEEYKRIDSVIVDAIRTVALFSDPEMSKKELAFLVIRTAETLAASRGISEKFLQSQIFTWLKQPGSIMTLANVSLATWKYLEPAKGDTF